MLRIRRDSDPHFLSFQWLADGKQPAIFLATELIGGVMSGILILVRKWNAWYRVLRHGHDFNLVDSLRLGLWLARG